jgi:two-component system LytT family response regulator
MLNCVAIDDEPLALEVVKRYISKCADLNLRAFFSNALEGQEYLKTNPVDLLFLDIQMPGINGLQLYRNLEIKPMVIFTTAHKEFAIDGFELDAMDYLLKPFDTERFQKAVNKAVVWQNVIAQNESQQNEFLLIHSEYKAINIPCNEIIFIEASNDYAKIHTKREDYSTLLSMKGMVEKLPKKLFMRVHRSYIVAINQISFIQFRKIGLINGMEFPIGDTYRASIAELKKK